MKRLIRSSELLSEIKYLYHGSPAQNLKFLEPRVSTHGKSWVYATDDIDLAAVFITNVPYGSDIYIQSGQINGKTYIAEKQQNIFKKAYDLSGSIYIISKDGFLENQTGFTKEFVNPNRVEILKEIKIPNMYDYILELEKKNKISIKRLEVEV